MGSPGQHLLPGRDVRVLEEFAKSGSALTAKDAASATIPCR